MQGQFEYLQGDGRTPQGHQGIEFKSVPREKVEDPDFLSRVLEYLAPWFCNSLDWNRLCNRRVKCPTVTYLPHRAATAGHRGMGNFHVVELFTIPSSLYRQPVTFCLFVLFLEGIPYLHFSLSFFKLIWKLSGPFTDGITKTVFLKWTGSKESAYSFLRQPAFHPGSHVTSNCGHGVQVPLGLKFPPSKSSPSAAAGTCQREWFSDVPPLQEGAASTGSNPRDQSSLINADTAFLSWH